MNENRMLSALSLAKRAGKVTTGFDAVIKLMKSGTSMTVVLANGLSEKTRKEILFYCDKHHVSCLSASFSIEEAEFMFGKKIGVFAVSDKGFERLLSSISEPTVNKQN